MRFLGGPPEPSGFAVAVKERFFEAASEVVVVAELLLNANNGLFEDAVSGKIVVAAMLLAVVVDVLLVVRSVSGLIMLLKLSSADGEGEEEELRCDVLEYVEVYGEMIWWGESVVSVITCKFKDGRVKKKNKMK